MVAQYREGRLVRLIDAGSGHPTDICFGGLDLDRMFVVSIGPDRAAAPAESGSGLAGRLLTVAGTGLTGLPENRFAL